MLEAKQFKYKNNNNLCHEQKIVKIKSMVTKIQQNGTKLQQDDPALKKLNFNKQREKLNCILLSQYLINNGHSINQADLQQIQDTDKHVASLKHSCMKGNQGFLIKSRILYKKGPVFGQDIYKLVLPEGLAEQMLYAIHLKHKTHASAC